MGRAEKGAVVAAAQVGDETAFSGLVERYRRELHVHCYRLLGSFEEAEDLVQETFLRAWRARGSFEGRSTLRAWLYRIATNASLDMLRRNARQVPSLVSVAEIPWLQPYPDRLLDEIAPSEYEPEAVAVARETIELGFLATIQLLTPQQRAVLILRDVLGWSAAETAEMLDTTLASANSALQRARSTLRERLPAGERDVSTVTPSPQERALLQRYVDALERADVAAAIAIVTDDVRVTMPPYPMCHDGRDALVPLLELAFDPATHGDWRLLPISANRLPAAANYLRRPGEREYRAFKIDVLRVENGAIAEITTFDARLFAAFGLPLSL